MWIGWFAFEVGTSDLDVGLLLLLCNMVNAEQARGAGK